MLMCAKFYLYRLVPSLCMIVVAKGVNLFYPNVNLLLHVNITMCKVWNKSYIPLEIYRPTQKCSETDIFQKTKSQNPFFGSSIDAGPCGRNNRERD